MIDALSIERRLWDIRLALSFGTSDPVAAERIRNAVQDLDAVRTSLVMSELEPPSRNWPSWF